MRLYPSSSFVSGELFFRDALTVESMDTLKIKAEINYDARFLIFQFENFEVDYNYKDHKLCSYRRSDMVTANDSDPYSITMSYFFEQQIEGDNLRVNLLTFIFDIAVGEDYRIFKVHGYFGVDIPKMTFRNEHFLSPWDYN